MKVLGNPWATKKDKNGVVTEYGYELKDLGVQLWPSFDKNGKVTRVEICLAS